MSDYLEHKTYELTCVSPMHIGSGETLKKYEYLYDNAKHVVYFPNKTKLLALLQKYNLFEEYLAYVNDQCQLTQNNLFSWLRQKRINEREIISASTRKAVAPSCISVSKGQRNMKGNINDLVTAITLPDGRLYIPGSSLKGVLRTGIIYGLLKKQPVLTESYEKQIEDILAKKPRKYELIREMNNIEKSLEDKLLNILNINTKNGSLKSVLRGLKVSDTIPAEKITSVIIQKKDSLLDKHGRISKDPKPMPLVRECIPSESKFRLQITMDKKMMAELGIKSIEEIIAYTKEYTAAVLKELQKGFNKNKNDRFYNDLFKEAEMADFFIGGGTGFLTKTIWLALFANRRTDIVRSLLDIIIIPKNHCLGIKDRFISPRSLKLAEVDGDYRLMGMCQIRELKS